MINNPKVWYKSTGSSYIKAAEKTCRGGTLFSFLKCRYNKTHVLEQEKALLLSFDSRNSKVMVQLIILIDRDEHLCIVLMNNKAQDDKTRSCA